MQKILVPLLVLFQIPQLAYAQSLQLFFLGIIDFFQFVVLPFLIALAFGFFVFGLVRFAIAGGGNDESRQKAKALIIWSVVAFVLFITLFGIVNLFAESVFGRNYDRVPAPNSDYCTIFGGSC
jgi:predicted PurR-regulated permease PerM